MQNQFGQREKVLSAIRRAIQIPSPKPHNHSEEHHEASKPQFVNTFSILGQESPREWLPSVGESYEDWVQLFAANSVDLRTEFIRVDSRESLKTQLQRLKTENGWKKVGIHSSELTDFAAQCLELETLSTDSTYDPHQLEKCDAGITTCETLVAQTGSITMTNRTNGGRVLSVLPPHHVVIATKSQLLPDLPAAFAFLEEKFGANYPSLMGFITGPSRTGDIERILVLGAHGPKKLTIFLLEE